MAEKESKDEFSFDFGKIKKIFKSKEKKTEKTDEEDKEISFNFKSAGNFLKRYNYIIIPVVLIIFCMYLSGHYRMYSDTLPVTDNWARDAVHNFYRNQIRDQVNQQYPNLPQENKDVLVQKQFSDYLSQNQGFVNEQIEQTSNQFKTQFKDDDGYTYLLAIDPYFYYRQSKNLVETGVVADSYKNGTIPWNDYMVAPEGARMTTSFHHYFIAYTYKIMNFFNRDISLMGAMFYVPIIISMLAVIPAFFVAKKIGGNVGGFFAAFIVAIHTAFINRTAGGFSDTDAYTVFFPLMIAWLFIEAFEAKNYKKKIIFGSLTGLFIGLFSFSWSGWWYIFDFTLAVIIIYIGYYLILHRKEIRNLKTYLMKDEIKKPFILLVTFIISSGLFVTIFKGRFKFFVDAFLNPLNIITLKRSVHANLWPNVYTTVAELNPASVPQIISNIGGSLFFIISLAGIILTLTSEKRKNIGIVIGSIAWYAFIIAIHKSVANLYVFLILLLLPVAATIIYHLYKRTEDVDMKYAIFLIVWYLGTIYASTKGVRFVLLLVPGFSIAFGIGIGKLYDLVSSWASKSLNLDKILVRTTILILILIMLISPIKSAANVAKNEVPSMNDGWYDSLTEIKMNSSEDAIINSWWDFGHWFKAIADRAVTFDGASQNRPQAHWIGHVLLTEDEDIAVGILNMLDCGANQAFEKLNDEMGDTVKTIDILYEILPKSKAQAKLTLKKYVSDEKVEEILKLTKCDAPENYFITSGDMVNKAGVWAHFGSWDFRRAKMWNSRKMSQTEFVKLATDELGYEEDEATGFYYEIMSITSDEGANSWISPWPGYASGLVPCQETKEENKTILICQNGIEILLDEKLVAMPTNEGLRNPYSFGYMEDGEFKLKVFENNTIEDLSVDLIENNGNYNIILVSKELAGSMFTRLFYYNGEGLEHFEKFSDRRDVTGSRILVWKVNW
jgi:dolichyl-phosphooligosaccharide-protein glycotransferase